MIFKNKFDFILCLKFVLIGVFVDLFKGFDLEYV